MATSRKRGLLGGIAAAAFAAASAVAAPARAQNADPFFFGDEASLGAGSVVASGRDSGAFWYNPAGFGALQRGLVSASASTFGLRLRTTPQALRVVSGGVERGLDLSSTDIISVPNAVVIATALGERYAIAGGLLVTHRDLRSALVEGPPEPARDAAGRPITIGQRLDLQTDQATYHFGGSFAAALSSNLRLGLSLFGIYSKATDSVQYAIDGRAGPNPTDERGFIVVNGRTTMSAFGGSAAVGVQWDLSSIVSLGLTLRAPELVFTASEDGGLVTAAANAGGADPPSAELTTEVPQPLDAFGLLLAPARAHLGVAFALGPPQSFLELGADIAHAVPGSELREERKAAFNARAGVRYMLRPEWIVGGGLFSDRTSARFLGDFVGADAVDYYGFTFGVSKRTPLALVKDPRPEALVLVTTLSLRASLGVGDARVVSINLDDPNAAGDEMTKVLFIDAMPYLGSSVIF